MFKKALPKRIPVNSGGTTSLKGLAARGSVNKQATAPHRGSGAAQKEALCACYELYVHCSKWRTGGTCRQKPAQDLECTGRKAFKTWGLFYDHVPTYFASITDQTILEEASKRLPLNVVALQETKAKKTATRKTNDGHLIVFEAKLSGRNVGRLRILRSTYALEHMVDSVEVIGPRLAIRRLRIDKRTSVSISNCYAPTSAAADEEKDAFYKELEEMIKRERSYYKYVVGDFNAVIHEEMPATARIGPNRRNKRERRTFDGPLRAMQSLSRKQLLHEKRGSAMDVGESECQRLTAKSTTFSLTGSGVCSTSAWWMHSALGATIGWSEQKFVSERESEDATSSDLLPYGCHITTQTSWRRPPLTTRGRRRKTCRKTIPCS
ncbi:hypothetical protein COOONC_09112 [Cooperia oncophora]